MQWHSSIQAALCRRRLLPTGREGIWDSSELPHVLALGVKGAWSRGRAPREGKAEKRAQEMQENILGLARRISLTFPSVQRNLLPIHRGSGGAGQCPNPGLRAAVKGEL